MVKHPKYQAMDDARQEAIPRLFAEICGNRQDLSLERVEPVVAVDPKPGPIPRPIFHVKQAGRDDNLAVIHPNGYAECFEDSFKESFDKMVQELEDIAKQALRDFNGH